MTFAVVAFITVATHSYNISEYDHYPGISYPSSGIASILIMFFIVMLLLPLFSMNYRYSLIKSDTYRQVAVKDKRIRQIDHLSTLVVVLIIYTVVFAILVLGIYLRNLTAINDPFQYSSNEYYKTYPVLFNYEYYVPYYFVSVLLGLGQYAISYLLVSRSNNLLNSLLTLTMGELFLMFFLVVPGKFINVSYFMFNGKADVTLALPIQVAMLAFEGLVTHGESGLVLAHETTLDKLTSVNFIIAMTVFVILATLGVIAFLLEKDPSSEYAGKSETHRPYQEIIYHAGFLAFGVAIGMDIILFSEPQWVFYLLFVVLYSATYYTLYGLLNRSFKLSLKQVLYLLGTEVLVILIPIMFYLIKK